MPKDAEPHAWFIALAMLGVLNVAVAAAYYVRIVGVIYFRLSLGALRAEGGRAARASRSVTVEADQVERSANLASGVR